MAEEQVKEETSLPPGFRFHPMDEELIDYYLVNKILDANFTTRAITDVDLNKFEPWDLPGKAKMGKKEWYFFNQRDRKYPTGVRTNRATNTGYWKTTGKDKEIFNSNTSQHIGMKKTLVFYKGRAPRGEKMSWVMHEYRLYSRSTTFKINKQDDAWVVCRVFQKSESGKKHPTSNHHPPTRSTTTMANTYNLQMAPTNVAMPIPDQPWQYFPMGRNYTVTTNNNIVVHGDMLENISSSATTSNLGRGSNNMVIDSLINCNPPTISPGPDGCFTMSSLKLNPSGINVGSSSVSAQATANIFRQTNLQDQETVAALYGGGMVEACGGLHVPSLGNSQQFMEDLYNYCPPPY